MSVDPIFTTLKRLIDPQRLNLYIYARNAPFLFTDPKGMDLELEAKSVKEAKKRYELFQKGLKKEDRSHTKFFVGDGKNGYEKGKFYILVDKDHNSDSKNFQAVQFIANERKETALISVRGPKETIKITLAKKADIGSGIVLQSFRDSEGIDFAVGYGFSGQTALPLRGGGAIRAGELYSLSGKTEVYVANDMPDVEIVATMFHELSAHVFLSNFGRDPDKGAHELLPNKQRDPKGETNKRAIEAEDEAKRNFIQP